MFYWIVLGVFLGNWIVVPLLIKRSFKEGFAIGLIAAGLCVIANLTV